MVETKAIEMCFREAMDILWDEWEVSWNMQEDSSRNSIWLGWNKQAWLSIILDKQQQSFHAKMMNKGCYSFHISVIYGDNNVTKR